MALKLEDELRLHIVRELDLGEWPEGVADDAPLFYEGLGLDSLDSLELVVILRKHYRIHITDKHKAREVFASLRTLADYVRAHAGQAAE